MILERFISQLQQRIPEGSSLIKELTHLLEISQDSVYRRLRGQSEFTFSELQKIAPAYNLSLDSLLSDNIGASTFRFNSLFKRKDTLTAYFSNLSLQLEMLSKTNGTLTFLAGELPISQSFQNSILRSFKIYYWQKVVLNQSQLKGVKFDTSFFIPASIDKSIDSLMHSYQNMNKSEIWNEETLDTTLRQIKYCVDAGLLSNDMTNAVCDAIIEMLNRLEEELEQQPKDQSKNRLTFYVSSVEIGNNVIMMDFIKYRRAFVKFNTFNTVSTEDSTFCEEIDEMLANCLAKSIEISGRSDVIRHQFFVKLKEKVDQACDY